MRFSPIRVVSAPARSTILLVVNTIAAALSGVAFGDARVDFDRQIRPMLSEYCLRCHGPDAKSREAGLRFDRRDVAYGKLPSGNVAIVPASAAKSELIRRVTSNEDDYRMPPPEFGKRPTSDQQKLLRRWIE